MSGEPEGPDLARAMLDQARARARRVPTEEERVAAATARAQRRRAKGKGKPGSDPTAFGAAITEFLRVRGWERDAAVHGVLARWPELVGAEIADHCVPKSLREGQLVLAAESTTWATQLSFLVPQITARVNAGIGAGTVRSVKVEGPTAAQPRGSGAWRVPGGRGPRDTYG